MVWFLLVVLPWAVRTELKMCVIKNRIETASVCAHRRWPEIVVAFDNFRRYRLSKPVKLSIIDDSQGHFFGKAFKINSINTA